MLTNASAQGRIQDLATGGPIFNQGHVKRRCFLPCFVTWENQFRSDRQGQILTILQGRASLGFLGLGVPVQMFCRPLPLFPGGSSRKFAREDPYGYVWILPSELGTWALIQDFLVVLGIVSREARENLHIFRNICTTFSQIWCDLRGFNRAKREKICNLGPSGTYSPPFAPTSSLRPLRKGPPLRFSALPQNPRRREPGPPEPPCIRPCLRIIWDHLENFRKKIFSCPSIRSSVCPGCDPLLPDGLARYNFQGLFFDQS